MTGGVRQPDDDITLASSNSLPKGIWSNSSTLWVANGNIDNPKLYAYNLADGSRTAAKDFNTPDAAGVSRCPLELWSDGRTMWVSDLENAKVYAFNMPGTDATLSSLTVSPRNIIGFKADRTSYAVGVDHTVAQVTISGTPNDSEAAVAITPADADPVTDGHQVSLSAGANTVTVTVTSEAGFTKQYRITVSQGVTANFGWKAGDDLDGLIAAGNQAPQRHLERWKNDVGGGRWIDTFVYAYDRDGSRDTSREFDLHSENGNPT